jgi:hypothetical protein
MRRYEPDAIRLAMARYPDMSPLLALSCFESDRRAAGLGALDEKRRNRRSQVRNTKAVVWTGKNGEVVVYSRVIDVPERMSYPKLDVSELVLLGPGASVTAERSFVTLKRDPARFVHLQLQVDPRDMADQFGRTMVARQLREMRRRTRA